MVDTNNPSKPNLSSLAKHFSLEQEDVPYLIITNYYAISTKRYTPKLNKDYLVKQFHGADKKYSLICRKHKNVIPKLLEKQVVEWYHNVLCHPGESRTELSIAQHVYWKY